ncbi:MAG: queuosine precursor transporter [Kiritimatiellia bacterium]|nr:queuosine precursor transporter [Kiritimatiellia bacterium]
MISPAVASNPRRRWLAPITAIFCTVLVVSNITAIKPLSLPGLPFVLMDGGNLLFPISYIFGDVLVEVYGYAQSRRIIWLGFALNLFAAATFTLVALLPPAPGWDMQEAFAAILLQTPRVVLGSLAAFWCGSFLNAFVMAKLKIRTRGRHLWLRTIGSTIVGQAIDSTLFTFLAFAGVWPLALVLKISLWNFVLKTTYEVLATPLTYVIVRRLKHAESSDPYDTHTDFSPFRLGDT